MGYRKFSDRDEDGWEVRDESDRRWVFRPLRGNEKAETRVTPPSGVDDPFELTTEELQKLLDGGRPARGRGRPPSPFRDDLD
ncbi:MAG TPA: hypothetical protein VKA44_05520 [Gemmatimonadota bacterium]|nr:hypothetical protein [Gemmatimonadota bacterium]